MLSDLGGAQRAGMTLCLRCGDVVLRAATAADDDVLVALMPNDFDHDPTFPTVEGRSLAQHREAWMRQWLTDFRNAMDLVFVVEVGGRPVGLQTLERDPERDGQAETTSFLIREARGHGVGVAMRNAVLTLAFERLGVSRAISSAAPDNVASRRVSERVGYRFIETSAPIVAGSPRPIDTFEMTAAMWFSHPRPDVVITGGSQLERMATAIARRLGPEDAGWAAEVLAARRRRLEPFAPVFWKPAADQRSIHAAYLGEMLASGRALGWATADSALIAARGRVGWIIDDAAVADDDWDGPGAELWNAFSRAVPNESVTFVCPAYEPVRTAFAESRDLRLSHTWWLLEREPGGGGEAGADIAFDGARVRTVASQPVYEPGGPMLLATDVEVGADLRSLPALAQRHGCAGVVVDVRADQDFDDRLRAAGFRPQCRYLAGIVKPRPEA